MFLTTTIDSEFKESLCKITLMGFFFYIGTKKRPISRAYFFVFPNYSSKNNLSVRISANKSTNCNTHPKKMKRTKPMRLTVLLFLKTAESLTRISQTQPTTGINKRITLMSLLCFSNHLSNVILTVSFVN